MKLTNENLNKYINLYLNDISDYGEDTEFLLAESVLHPISKLLLESKINTHIILEQELKSASTYEREILDDFMLYVENI